MTVYYSMQHRERSGDDAHRNTKNPRVAPDQQQAREAIERVSNIAAINQVLGILNDHGLQGSPLYAEARRALAAASSSGRPLSPGEVAALRVSAIVSYRRQEEKDDTHPCKDDSHPCKDRSQPCRQFDNHEHHDHLQDYEHRVLHRVR
ncbi:hypothetical protein ABT336_13385 [Micromonospora sp. NPDC000207]|uniref:hypothetical protein n=1 Tax=Micromonospora sp. NPDC000207 TaxID=3154246 RepID=UPI0033208AB6